MSIETELKLHIASEKTDRFRQHPLLQSAIHTHAPQRLYNTYFDTPDHALLQQGVGLRVRCIGDKRLQTLKTAGSGLGGLHQRQEWEMEIVEDTPDYSLFPEGALPAWCSDKKNLEQIQPLFVTDFMRTTWLIAMKDGSKIEMVLDQGEIKTQTASIPLSEIELELKAGSPETLYQVALTLQKTVPLKIENKSKAAYGYALHKPIPLTYRKAGIVALTSDMTSEQAFIHILWHCLSHLQANEDMVLYGEDIEGVHQMRVALRRLRSCLSLYNTLIPKKKLLKLRTEVKWLTQILGIARDWDVFALSLQEMQPFYKKSLSSNELLDLQVKVANFQTCAYVTVRDALHSSRYNRLLLWLGKWLTQRRWRRKLQDNALQRLDSPVSDFASQILELHYQRVYQQGKNFAQLNSEQLHNLRISIKKMGYGTRFFTELYPQQAARYAKNLSRLQDELGILNDANVASHKLNQIGLNKNASVRHFLNGWYAHQQSAHLARLETAWQAFLEQNIFWRNNTDE
ncbi:CYTH and CHAD domain-containing protein [Candidatus Parabeggiatoa sp. HSG14]|uniref:CYTH and CHAD domain-containing protein n=1 Tax=Candidatus Parabeggiatoa sp. HSG14 TaxID=3055593 RepID=UPI0025A886CC|nr:CYTH and CHAD domain-containing protein [Thiotrichales bacterium HSG14]